MVSPLRAKSQRVEISWPAVLEIIRVPSPRVFAFQPWGRSIWKSGLSLGNPTVPAARVGAALDCFNPLNRALATVLVELLRLNMRKYRFSSKEKAVAV